MYMFRHALQNRKRMLRKTSIRPHQTKTTSSTRLWRTTGTSFSMFGSPSKSWCRRRKIKTPPSRKTITAKVNPTRSAARPAGSIPAIKEAIWSATNVFISTLAVLSEPNHAVLPDDDDSVGRVRFAGVRGPNYAKHVRSGDRWKNHRYSEVVIRFHGGTLSV